VRAEQVSGRGLVLADDIALACAADARLDEVRIGEPIGASAPTTYS
jgi:hypothetical protein